MTSPEGRAPIVHECAPQRRRAKSVPPPFSRRTQWKVLVGVWTTSFETLPGRSNWSSHPMPRARPDAYTPVVHDEHKKVHFNIRRRDGVKEERCQPADLS